MKRSYVRIAMLLAAVVAAGILTPGCGGGGGGTAAITGTSGGVTTRGTGNAKFVFNFGDRSSSRAISKIPDNTASITINVFGPDWEAEQSTTLTNLTGVVEASLTNIPAGHRSFEVIAYDSAGNVVAHRTESAIIYGGQTTEVRAVLGMTIMGEGTTAGGTSRVPITPTNPTVMTYQIGEKLYIKNSSGISRKVSVVESSSSTELCNPNNLSLDKEGIMVCPVPAPIADSQLLSYLQSNSATAYVKIDGVQVGSITVPSSSSASSYTGNLWAYANTTDGMAPLDVNFAVYISNISGSTVSWDFGDGQTASGSGASYAEVTHTYTAEGNYNATVTVVDGATTYTESFRIVVITGGCSDAALDYVAQAKSLLFQPSITETSFNSAKTAADNAVYTDAACPDANFVSGLLDLLEEAERIENDVLFTQDTLFPLTTYTAETISMQRAVGPLLTQVLGSLPRIGGRFSAENPKPSEYQQELETTTLAVINSALAKLDLVSEYAAEHPNWYFSFPRDASDPSLGQIRIDEEDIEALAGVFHLERALANWGLAYNIDDPTLQLVNGSWVSTWSDSDWMDFNDINKVYTPSEYLPSGTYGTLRTNGAAYLAQAQADFVAGFTLLKTAIDSILESPTPELAADSISADDANEARFYQHYLDELIASFSGTPTTIRMLDDVDCWYTSTYYGGTSYIWRTVTDSAHNADELTDCGYSFTKRGGIDVTINFGALFVPPVSDLRTIMPNKRAIISQPGVYEIVIDESFLTSTFNGVFPNGIPRTMFDENHVAFQAMYYWTTNSSTSQNIDFSTFSDSDISLNVAGTTYSPALKNAYILLFCPGFATGDQYGWNCTYNRLPTSSDPVVTINEFLPESAVLSVAGYEDYTLSVVDRHDLYVYGASLTPTGGQLTP